VTQPEIDAAWVTICLDAQPVQPVCCFTGGTHILTADGSEQPIKQVRVGDLVLGANGRVNRVIRLVRPLLGERLLYELNGGEPFVTAEHPFRSEDGWKSINPLAMAAENRYLKVGQLRVGDRLLVCKGCLVPTAAASPGPGDCLELIVGSVELLALRGHHADPSTPLFNLLLNGDHSYMADGFLVHNKGGGLYG
jgi:hypothetical protein